MSNTFQRATKRAARLRLALAGPAGSGKTFTALTVATHLGGRVAVIDTEKGSASKYADLFSFDVLELADSFHPDRYIGALREAERLGYDSVIVDSLSHAWIGKDGGLDLHDQAEARQKHKNSWAAWAEVTPHHNALVQALLASRCHVIATLRTKTDWVVEGGKPRKVGLAPMMRDGIEYEFDVVGDLDMSNTLCVSKTRCSALSGQVFPKPGADFARILSTWLGNTTAATNGVASIAAAPQSVPALAPTALPEPSPEPMNQDQANRIDALAQQLGIPNDAFERRIHVLFGHLSPMQMDTDQATQTIALLESKLAQQPQGVPA